MSLSTAPKGHFIVIEGPDGSGKTTQLRRLENQLSRGGMEVVIAREPGGTPWGQKIRKLFLDGQGELAPMAEVMLLLAAKAQLLHEVILPAYNAGKVVLMDRYSDSLIAYQGYGRQLGARILRDTLRASELSFPPTMTLFMNTPWEVCSGRILARAADENNSIDALSAEYHKRVHRGYADIIEHAQETQRPHAVIDGNDIQVSVFINVMEALAPHIDIYKGSPHRGVLNAPQPFMMRD